MKRTLLKIFHLGLGLLSTNFIANAQTVQWAQRAGSYAYDYGRGICTDASNNVYVTGEFENTGYFNWYTVQGKGNHDIFISKYNSSGTIQWVRTAGGTSGDVGHAISCDLNGNVYVTGEFQLTADFGPIKLYGGYLNDIFVAKYDAYGNIQWAKKAGGSESDKGLGVADKYGNVYVTGFFQGAATFGSTTLYSNGEKDVFLAKYNTYGTLLWVKKFGSSMKDEGRSVTIDPSGNVIVAGYFQGTIGFGNQYLTSGGDHDGFITKFDANGNVLWARKMTGPYYEVTRGVTSDNYGNIYATGVFCYGAKFEGVAINPYGQGDVFVASYNPSGALRWVKRAGSNLYDEGAAIRAEGDGTVYLTGRFSGSAVFGTTVLNAADRSDVFIASLSSWGSFRWAIKGGGSADQSYSYGEDESGLAIAVDGSRSVIATGAYRTNISFGSAYLNQYYNTDVFITKLRQTTTSAKMLANMRVQEADKESFNLYVDAHDSFSYQWLKDNERIPGAVYPELNVKEAGKYSTVIINGNDTGMTEEVFIDPATIKRSSITSREVKAYPNPARGIVNLNFPDIVNSTLAELHLYNMTGQAVGTKLIPLESGRITIDVSDIPDGIYIARFNTLEGSFYSRFLVKNFE